MPDVSGSLCAQRFERKDKYLVVKLEDIEAFLTEAGIECLNTLLEQIRDGRQSLGKGDNRYIVVNEDEPYGEKIWQVIERGEVAKQIVLRPTGDIDCINAVDGVLEPYVPIIRKYELVNEALRAIEALGYVRMPERRK